MKERTGRLTILALAMLLAWVERAPCADPPPARASGTGTSIPTSLLKPLTAPPPAAPVESLTSVAGGASSDSLPSTVSPAIERFLKEHGRDLPLQPPPAAPVASQVRAQATPAVRPGLVTPRDEPAGGSSAPALPSSTLPPAASRLSSRGPAPHEVNLSLKPAPLEPTDLRFPINLATALRLADARPLVVAAAQAGIWVAEAELTRAKVLWIPTAQFSVDYLRHDGGGPDFNKGIMTAPSVNYAQADFGGFLYVNMADAYFQPLVQRQVLNARHWDTQAAKNDALFQTAEAYFRVHQYRGMYVGALYCVERGHDLVERVAQLSRELVPLVEVDRARNMLADLEQRAVYARQEWRVASADLTQVLRLDPRAVVVPLEHDHSQVTLIDLGRGFDDLMPIALANRPEISSRMALIRAAEYNVRREKARPLVPLVGIGGFQTPAMYNQIGVLGLGPNSSLNQWRLRADVSLQLIWQLDAFGIGNLARIKGMRGVQSRAIIDLRNAQDTVAADVTRALARVQASAPRVLQADRALRTAIITFNGHLEGLEQTRRLENFLYLTFRPQEAVYSLQQMNVSFEEYFTTVAEYNRAQFDLYHALGYPASELTVRANPGAIVPVETGRPAFLPPVGNGPPPATR